MLFLLPAGWPRPKGFSHGTVAEGRQVFVAGQIGTPDDGAAPANDFADQVRRALERTVAILAEAGARPTDIARQTWYVTDIEAYKAAGRPLGEAFAATIGRHFPAITLVEVRALIDSRAMVEIDSTAVVPPAPPVI